MAGLGVLRKNLEEHVEDLHRWKKFLDLDRQMVDLSGELRPQLMGEFAEKSFQEQLDYMTIKLEAENGELLKLLKQKEADALSKKAQEAKKNQRQVPKFF